MNLDVRTYKSRDVRVQASLSVWRRARVCMPQSAVNWLSTNHQVYYAKPLAAAREVGADTNSKLHIGY